MIDSFKKKIQPYCDLVTVGRTKLSHIDIENSGMTDENKTKLREMAKSESYEKIRLNCCPEVFDKLSINWNGDATACCGDYDGKMIVGNIMESALSDIWNCKKMKQYRDILSRREYDKIEHCKDCYDIMYIQKQR